ncbi:T9SS type A sorting domain-containing protein [Flavobacterium sp.]|uniref:T9SS type A sorting domain-containing protein n=1 Tax=Flavobacterium sp. TaxID=239 RepID=UPI0025E996B0|nr:T9SS type A sorting domain-containing protein [Flavobacterium sp.]
MFTNLRVTESESNVYNQGAFTVTSTYSTQPFLVCNNKMYFNANSDFTNQYGFNFRLFQTDGTVAGTSHVAPTPPTGTTIPTNFITSVNSLTAINNNLFASGNIIVGSGGGGTSSLAGIFKVDASNTVTQIAGATLFAGDSGKSADAEQGAMRLFNGEYYFIGNVPNTTTDIELMKFNPTTEFFTKVSAPAALGYILFNTNNGYSRYLVAQEWNSKLYFVKADGSNGAMFATDGTLASTTQVSRGTIQMAAPSSALATYSGAPNELNVLGSGLYYAAKNNGSAAISLYRFFDSSLSTNVFEKTSFSIYPNPASTNVQISSADKINSITIYDVVGKQIFEKNTNDFQDTIDISNFTRGIYFAKIQSENSNYSTKKFIKN